MPYIKINDLEMFYEEFGRGEPLLFLHSHFSRGLLAFSAQIQPQCMIKAIKSMLIVAVRQTGDKGGWNAGRI